MGAGPLGKQVKEKHDNILTEMLREVRYYTYRGQDALLTLS